MSFPDPDLLVCYCIEHIVAQELPSFSDLSDGRHLANDRSTWHLPLCLARPRGSPLLMDRDAGSGSFHSSIIRSRLTVGFVYGASP